MIPGPAAVHAGLSALLEDLTARRDDPAGTGGGAVEGAVGAVAAIEHPAWTEGPVVLAAGQTHLPGTRPEPPEPVTAGTVMDLASVTKVVTTLTALRLWEQGRLDLDAPVADALPGPDARVTARHLLTHTAGLPATLPLWEAPSREAGLERVRTAPLTAAPGTAHEYSCIGFIQLGLLLEALTGHPLPELARELVLEPAGAQQARWIAAPHGTLPGALPTAATEAGQVPARGTIRGATHDEAAWALGGVGNAGLHATAADLLSLGRVLAGRSPALMVSPAAHALLRSDQLGAGVRTGQPWRQGLGLRIGQDLARPERHPRVVGHTGFSGAAVGADPDSGAVWALLSNRVHPHRDRFTVEGTRRRLAELALSPRS